MEEIIPWKDWIGLIEPHYFPVTRADEPLDEQYALAVHKVARLTRCNLFDLRAWFLRERDLGSLYCIDGMHLNGKGHQVIAQAVSAASHWYSLSMIQNNLRLLSVPAEY